MVNVSLCNGRMLLKKHQVIQAFGQDFEENFRNFQKYENILHSQLKC